MTSILGIHIADFIFGHMKNGCYRHDVLDKCFYQLVKSENTKEIFEKRIVNCRKIASRRSLFYREMVY